MVVKEFCVFAFSVQGQFLHLFVLFDNNGLSIRVEGGVGIHIEVAAFQTVNAFPDFGPGYIFSFPFIL